MSIFYMSLKDFFSKDSLKYLFIPFIASLVLFFALSYFAFDAIEAWVQNIFQANSILAWFYSFSIFQVFLSIITFLLAVLLVLYTSVLSSVLISSFLTPSLIKTLYAKHYNFELKEDVSLIASLKIALKLLAKTLVLFIICSLLLFVPMLNVFSFYIFFYYIFSSFLLLDISSTVLNKAQFSDFWDEKSSLWLKVVLAIFYILSSIPILGLFLQGFFSIYLAHYFANHKLYLKAA